MSYRDWQPLVGRTPGGLEVVLRRLHQDDLDLCGQWINQPAMRQVLRVDYPVSHKEEQLWIDRVTGPLPLNPTELALGISVQGQLVGSVGLHDISGRHRHAMIGILIGDQTWRGQGIGLMAYQLLHDYAFGELNLEALQAQVYGQNQASQRLHRRAGYSQVGCIPRWYFKAGDYQDLLIYHLFRTTWQASNAGQ